MIGKKGKGQYTLEAYITREKVSFEWLEYSTDFHTLRVKDTQRDNFLAKINKKDKAGEDMHTTESQHLKMCEWIQQQAKPREPKMSGKEWEASMRALMNEVFDCDWDKYNRDKTPSNSGANDGPLSKPINA